MFTSKTNQNLIDFSFDNCERNQTLEHEIQDKINDYESKMVRASLNKEHFMDR
jgi:hypothetical protein